MQSRHATAQSYNNGIEHTNLWHFDRFHFIHKVPVITLAPTKEIAMGKKMSDLATFSALLRSARDRHQQTHRHGERGGDHNPEKDVVAEGLKHPAVGEDRYVVGSGRRHLAAKGMLKILAWGLVNNMS